MLGDFEQLLKEKGYIKYRKTSKGFVQTEDCSYSTMTEGGIDFRYIKGDNEIVVGLHEKDKPPTLIYPRPNMVYTDDEMNRCLEKYSAEEIFQAIFNRNIILKC